MTPSSIKNIQRLGKRFAVLPATLLLAATVQAQEPDTALIRRETIKYANHNAVITNYQERLIISFEDGELVASSKTKKERLLIGDLSASKNNYDYIIDHYEAQVSHLDAVAYIPQKDGSYKQNHKFTTYSQGVGEGISEARALITHFTGLTKGSFIRMTANRDYPDLTFLPDYVVDDAEYPIEHTEFQVEVPKFVQMKFVIKGENTGIIKQSQEEKNGNIIYKFSADNVPAYKHFDNVPHSFYYRPHVICYIASYKLPGTSKDSLLLSDPEHLYKKEYKYIRNLNVKQDTSIKKLAMQLTQGDVTQAQKAAHLYDWVQKNIHYVGFEIGLGGFVPREADTVLKKKYGDCKDMSSLLMQMGRMVGLETYFAWIGTTKLPYTFEETPIPGVCNHMICALKLNNEWIFMDGTHPNLPFGTNRDDIQGKQAMIAIDDEHFKIVTIPVVAAEKNVTTDNTYIKISDKNDENLTGNFSNKLVGYPAWNLGHSFYYLTKDKEEREKLISSMMMRGSNKFNLENYDLNIKDTGTKAISISGNFNIDGYVRRIGKDYIVNMNLNRHFADDYIDTANRRTPWYFDYKHVQKEVVELEIPKGCKVTYLPKNTTGKLNDLWSYAISYKSDGKKITLTKEYKLNTMSVGRNLFTDHNKAIHELENQYKESVVLTAK